MGKNYSQLINKSIYSVQQVSQSVSEQSMSLN